ncbi:GNAT family N-acetyltransferase [Acidovorax lacteus]|uniref:GNAT family N-acetyltransferase n=1 Tax=Acidovorax lacteus TaxID=1924988 RepID=A0ABP8L0S1_9BURK
MAVSEPSVCLVQRVDYADPVQAQALVDLLDGYARDPAGGGEPLAAHVRAELVPRLQALPQAFSVMAWHGPVAPGNAVGLVNCLEGFSTFAARPLVNVHDVVVQPAWRGRGVARAMLRTVEAIARERGACKLTLEVLSGNHPAMRLYRDIGFEGYALDPAMGAAVFLQKKLP